MSVAFATPDAEVLAVPCRSRELVLAPGGKEGAYVVKNRATGAFFQIGEFEHFLLVRLDGKQTEDELRAQFEAHFGEPLSADDLAAFLQLAKRQKFLALPEESYHASPAAIDVRGSDRGGGTHIAAPSKPWIAAGQSILYFRFSVFDPDRLFNWLEPRLRPLWTRAFLILSALGIALAASIAVQGWADIRHRLIHHMDWQTVVVVWTMLVAVTLLHEFAHGLTCKHYGGEVHEVGLLVMFFVPYFYCNVSDAWLMPKRSQRLWITAAGGYCDLCVWSLAVFVWRLTVLDSLFNYLAWCVLVVCGARIFFNCNPLMKLDGYYLLSDWLGIPNLRRRGQAFMMANIRWLLWGAPKPVWPTEGLSLCTYGILSWLFVASFLRLIVAGLFHFMTRTLGLAGYAVALYFGSKVIYRMFDGISQGEITKMFLFRRLHTSFWLLGFVVAAAALVGIRFDQRANGQFQIRPSSRTEVRAPVAGFLREIKVGEGDRIEANTVIGRMEIPDIESRLAQKRAELDESSANLKKLTAGARVEEVAEQRLRIKRLEAWVKLAEHDLDRAKQGLHEELTKLDLQLVEAKNDLEFANASIAQAETLFAKGAMAELQFSAEKKRRQALDLRYQQAQAARRAREASGTLEFEAEFARREKELGDATSALKLLEAGGRTEEVEAEQARQHRLTEELKFLVSQQGEQELRSPITGLATTPLLAEKVGQYFEKGALICLVENTVDLEADLAINEQDIAGVEPGQTVDLKARALPFDVFQGVVERVAPAAITETGHSHGMILVHCRIQNAGSILTSGMTGYGRIHRAPQSLLALGTSEMLRYVRTEFWW